MQEQHCNHRVSLIILFLTLIGVYFLTYRGIPLSQDGYFIIDSTESLVRRGNFYRTYQFSQFNQVAGEVPWGAPLQEPLAPMVAAPFFWLGQTLPNVGQIHTTYLVNIFVTALTVISSIIGVMLLGYSRKTAWIMALTYGLTTLAWPYSRYIFREPLMSFFIFWVFIAALKLRSQWQDKGRIPWQWGGLMLLSFVLAFLTKAISIAFLPGLIIVLLPPLREFVKPRNLLAIVGLIVLIVGFIYVNSVLDTQRLRYSFDYWIAALEGLETRFLIESALGYQFSFSRSIWLHTPVLLIGFYGAWMLLRRGEWRLVIAGILSVILMSCAYAIAHGVSWWGSWGWGPRYMLPLIPLLMLWLLPILEGAFSGWRRVVFIALAFLGAVIQLVGMAVPLSNYYTDLNRAGLLTDWAVQTQWGDYNWTWKWSPLKYHIDHLDFRFLDTAWRFADPTWTAPALSFVLLAAGIGLLWWIDRKRLPGTAVWLFTVGMALFATGTVYAGLYALRMDERYIGEYEDVRLLADQLTERLDGSEAVFVDKEQYMLTLMNSFKAPVLTVGLPFSPGENYGPPGPQIVSDNIEQLVDPLTARALHWTGQHYDEAWLIASINPFEADKVRPVEHLMVQWFYPVESFETSTRARAIRFVLDDAYNLIDSAFTNIQFENGLLLEGFGFPVEPVFKPGDVVPITLSWIPQERLPEDYNISVQVATLDGFPLAQRDGQPQGTFGKMSQWPVDERQLDNHGLQLPPDIPPGEYAVQVVVYRWQDGTRLHLLDDNGEPAGDVAQVAHIRVEGN